MTTTERSRVNLRIPGPVPLPDDVLELAGSQMINHRGPEYAAMLDRMTRNLQTVFATAGDVYFITSSGTGSMETAVVNTLSPGDNVLSLVIGVFGKRFAEIAEAYGADVTRLEFPLGKAADPDEVAQALADMPDCKAVLFTHNESSTGTTNPLQEITSVVHQNSRRPRIGRRSQQRGRRSHIGRRLGHRRGGDGLPEILGFAPGHQHGVIQRKGRGERTRRRRCRGTTSTWSSIATTWRSASRRSRPACPAMYTLERTLDRMVAEGVENVFSRHDMIAEHTRKKARSLGLEILPEERYASATVTAVRMPEGIDGQDLVARVRANFDVVLGGRPAGADGQDIPGRSHGLGRPGRHRRRVPGRRRNLEVDAGVDNYVKWRPNGCRGAGNISDKSTQISDFAKVRLGSFGHHVGRCLCGRRLQFRLPDEHTDPGARESRRRPLPSNLRPRPPLPRLSCLFKATTRPGSPSSRCPRLGEAN